MNIFIEFLLIALLFVMSHLANAKLDIKQGDILALDPSQACDAVALKLEKMEAELDEKKITIEELLKSLRSAATPAAQYGNISLDYHKELDRFKSMKNDYDQLIVERENHCMPISDENSTN